VPQTRHLPPAFIPRFFSRWFSCAWHLAKLLFKKAPSAVLTGKADLKEVIDAALERRRLYQTKTVLFVKDVRESLNSLVTS
jgi:hypothetical protein